MSSASLTHLSASPAASTSSSIFSTRAGAPPCSGPESAPTAPLSAAATSAPVEAMTRAVNVEAFIPCSAAEIQYASIALTWSGSASPRQRIRKRSGIELALSTSRCGHRRAADAARGLGDERERHHGGAGEVVARLLVGDVDQRLEAPLRPQQRQRGLDVDARVARADRERVRRGRRQAGLERAVDEQAPDLLERHLADDLLDVDAAVAQRAAVAVGLGDLGGEGDDAFEPGLDVAHAAGTLAGWLAARWRRAFSTLPHACIEHQRRRPAGERS